MKCPHVEPDALPCLECRLASIDWTKNAVHRDLLLTMVESFPIEYYLSEFQRRMKVTQQLQDSGQRRKFKTGAVRDRGDLKPRPDLISPHANIREGMIFALGAEKYEGRNWEKGMPISECLASAQRHIEDWKLGLTNEDHIAMARWNIGAIIHYEEEIKASRLPAELADMPHYVKQAAKEVGGAMIRNAPKSAIVVDEIGKPVLFAGKEIIYDTTVEPAAEPKHYYVAGPMRGYDLCNFPLFDRVTEVARAQGLDITSPAELDRDHGIDPVANPNSIDDVFTADPNLVQTLAQRDCGVILNLEKDRGDGLILLPLWNDSTGARAEVALALWLGLTFKTVCVDYGCDPFGITFQDTEPYMIVRALFHQES